MSTTTHDRQFLHHGSDLDTNIELDGATASYADGTDLHLVISDLDGRVADIDELATGTVNFILNGSTGVKGDIELGFRGTWTAVRLFADQVGSMVVDIWKDSYANFPPVVGDSITASAKPTISATNKSEDTTLTGWTVLFYPGDILRINIDSIATITQATLSLTFRRASSPPRLIFDEVTFLSPASRVGTFVRAATDSVIFVDQGFSTPFALDRLVISDAAVAVVT